MSIEITASTTFRSCLHRATRAERYIHRQRKNMNSMDELNQGQVVRSRWWYGVAFFVTSLTLTWVSYGILRMVSSTLSPSSTALVPSSPELGGVFLFSAAVSGLFVVITSLLAPLYSLCLYLDVHSLQTSEKWAPNRIVWGGISVLHVLSLVFSPVQLITIPAGGIYLYTRYRQIGLGSSQ